MGDTIIKWLLILIFGPTIFLVAVQVLAPIIAAILSVLVLIFLIAAVIGGIFAGISAGFVLRRRLPPRNGDRYLPHHYVPPVRRPRGGQRRDEDAW